MANNFDSNVTRKVARVFLDKFETMRVLSKSVNVQLLSNVFNPSTGTAVDFKRPTDYKSTRTSDGDISAGSPSDIIAGKATGNVQDYITVWLNWSEADESLKMDQLMELVAPAAERIVTDLETDFAAFMMKNSGNTVGTYGTAVTTWSDVARAGAFMKSLGIPQGEWNYVMNPFTMAVLADQQRSLGAGGNAGSAVMSALQQATVMERFAGFSRVMGAQTLATHTQPATGDRAGTINGAPDVTYLTHKDSFQQTITVAGIGTFTGTIPAGTMIAVTGRNRLNLSTRKAIVDDAGANILHHGVVVQDASLTSGGGDLVVSGPGLFEASGAYNTTDTALGNGDVITLLGADSTLYQPNLFYHKNAFAIGGVPIKKLFSTDTLATTKDGLQIRVSKYSDGDKNLQKMRFDLRPAYGVLNPFLAGQGWG